MNILIIGYGIIGHWVHGRFPDATPFDLELNENTKNQIMNTAYDIAFVCVPTDMMEDGSCDTSIVEQVITEHKGHVEHFCIRSTISPGTTAKIRESIYDKVAFSPEYAGATQHANAHEYNFVILGGNKETCNFVLSAYEKYVDGRFKTYLTDSLTAEVVKYAENTWIAAKVSFCNEFARICKSFGVNYREFRELWLADPRINPSHTFVYEKTPFYDSHCLNKDIPGIVNACEKAGYDARLIKAIEAYNREAKELKEDREEKADANNVYMG